MSCIDKKHLPGLLAKIEKQAHPIYALIAGLPKANFHLFRDYDYDRLVEYFPGDQKNTFTLEEFRAREHDFHDKDKFSLYFIVQLDRIPASDAEVYTDRIRIDTSAEAAPVRFSCTAKIFLQSYCEKCQRENRPLTLTPQVVARFGFTPEDVVELKKPLTRYNARARKQIRAEYEALKKLDFLKEKV